MPRLHDYVLSADCYAVRLMFALLGAAYERVAVDFHPGREHEGEAFRALNPAGTIPVLEDGGMVLTELGDILRHIAQTYDAAGTWYPRDGRGLVESWLAFARTSLAVLETARLAAITGVAADHSALRQKGRLALRALDDRLIERTIDGREWIVRRGPTIADIAAFPLVALSHDSGIGLEEFPTLSLWQRRVRRLPGFVGMPGIPDYF